MKNATIKQFIKFVLDQPADKIIDHESGWSGCAVGEFAKSIGRADEAHDVSLELRRNELKLQGIVMGKDTFKANGGNSLVQFLNSGPSRISTYGKLAKEIDAYEHLRKFK